MNWQIEAGYYLYKDKFSINSNDPSLVLGDYVFPLGKLKDDLAFGEVEVYYGQNQLVIPFETTKENIRELNIKNLEIYFDKNLNFVKEFKLRGVPTTILINKDGNEFGRIIGEVDFQDEKFLKWLLKYD